MFPILSLASSIFNQDLTLYLSGSHSITKLCKYSTTACDSPLFILDCGSSLVAEVVAKRIDSSATALEIPSSPFFCRIWGATRRLCELLEKSASRPRRSTSSKVRMRIFEELRSMIPAWRSARRSRKNWASKRISASRFESGGPERRKAQSYCPSKLCVRGV